MSNLVQNQTAAAVQKRNANICWKLSTGIPGFLKHAKRLIIHFNNLKNGKETYADSCTKCCNLKHVSQWSGWRCKPIEWKMSTTTTLKTKVCCSFSFTGAIYSNVFDSHLPRFESALTTSSSTRRGCGYLCFLWMMRLWMYQWGKSQNAKNVFLLPDGNGRLHSPNGHAGLKKDNLGFVMRSWRYAMYVENGEIKKMFSDLSPRRSPERPIWSVGCGHTCWTIEGTLR